MTAVLIVWLLAERLFGADLPRCQVPQPQQTPVFYGVSSTSSSLARILALYVARNRLYR